MATKRGLGIAARDSIFSNTTEKKKTKPEKPEKKVVESVKKDNNWVKYSLQVRPDDKALIEALSFYMKKEKREVLAEIIDTYRKKGPKKSLETFGLI
tara:strand:- start:2099 stop:2389 length:291 start_codon:yes stop_codon:yes gene_type:complete